MIINRLFLFLFLIGLLLPAASRSGFASAEDENSFAAIYNLAVQGDAEAQFSLAMRYDLGDGIERNPRQAVLWFKKSAEQGVTASCLYLGMKYEFGNGIEQDSSKAIYWYTQAAEQGWPMAQFLLATVYLNGKDSPADPVQATAWLTLAAEQMYPGAQEMLEEAEQGLSKDERDKVKKLIQKYRNTLSPPHTFR